MARAALLALLVMACGPTIDVGTVLARRDVPAHDEEYQSGSICVSHDRDGYCTLSIPIYSTRHVERACYITLAADPGPQDPVGGYGDKAERSVDCGWWDSPDAEVGRRADFRGPR